MSKVIKIIFTVIVVSILGYLLYVNFPNVWSRLYERYFPCRSPIAYNLGSFDPKFGLSKSEFLESVGEAESIWQKPINKELFTYDPADDSKGDLKVNLIYDYRQEATEKIRALGLTVADTKASYDSLLAKYKVLQRDYLAEKKEYFLKVEAYKKHQAELSDVRRLEADLNKKVDNINALVDVINSLARTLNINVGELNNIGESRGEEFTEGEFKESSAGREIDIYEFSNHQKLVRVLAHELGHALGLEHVSDPAAIMYYLNENKNGKLTVADLAVLKTLCKIK